MNADALSKDDDFGHLDRRCATIVPPPDANRQRIPERLSRAFEPTMAAAQARIAAVQPEAYARTRNALNGAVSHLSPYITHGFVTPADVLAGVSERHALHAQHKFVYELGWRAYFRHVWQHRGDGILQSLQEGLLPDDAEFHRAWPWTERRWDFVGRLLPIDRRCDSFSKWWKRASRRPNSDAGPMPTRRVVRSQR